MHARSRLSIAWLLTALAVCALFAGRARAGDDDDLVEDPMAVPDGLEQMVVIRNLDANIDNWLFGNRRFSDNPSQKLSLILKVKSAAFARMAGLSESQREKLLLAGEGDIRRFLDRVDEIKLKHRSNEMPQGAWNRIFQEIQPLRDVLLRNQLFGSDSLFAKTARKTLTSEQAARYEKNESERLLFQHRTRIASTVVRLSNYLGLRDEQRKRLTQVMLEKSQPLPDLGETDRQQLVGLVLLRGLPEKEIKPIFDADQWRGLQHLFEHVPQVLPMLRQQGILLNGQKEGMLDPQREVIGAGRVRKVKVPRRAPIRQPAGERGDGS
jgi:hypothetical protein